MHKNKEDTSTNIKVDIEKWEVKSTYKAIHNNDLEK